MGRSPKFCFSIKACAGASPDDDDELKQLELQSKSSPEKRKWRFSKKSIDRHVPSNTIISEPLHAISENKFQESTSESCYSIKASSNPKKAYIVEQTSSGLSEVPQVLTSTTTVGADYNIPEVVIVIQTSIRSYLAKKELQKLKKVVKLQAVARGYLVRRQAAGTLRCIQAIVKMQALVRARHSVQLAGLCNENKVDVYSPTDVGKYSDVKKHKTSATRNSISSAFARQLLESTPKTKPIHISCDPLRPDSAWNWLERWMAVTSTSKQNLVFKQDDLGKYINRDLDAYDVDVQLDLIYGHGASNSELTDNPQEVPEFKGDTITNRVELSTPAFISDQCSISPVQESVYTENDEYLSKSVAKGGSDCFSNQVQHPLDASLRSELDGNPNKPDFIDDNFNNCGIKELNEAPKIEGKSVNGSRKLMNTAFAAVQSKFEELSSASASNRYSDHASRDVNISKSVHSIVNFTSYEVNATGSVHSTVESKLKEVEQNEKLSLLSPEGQVAASEYVTEISVPSPNRLEAATSEIAPKTRTPDETNLGFKSVANGSLNFKEFKTETGKDGAFTVDSVEGMQVQKQSAEKNISSMQSQDETNVYRRSQNESPRSYTDFTDSPMTPSSQMSLRVRTVKAGNSISTRKKGSQLTVKKSPTSSKSDSGAQISGGNLWKGTKNVKRPNSSGNDRANDVGQDDGSSSALPNYMQFTESAKAKINTSFSPKSNFGLHLENNHIKKRYSLPIENVKQGSSPRVQNLTSQSPQILKGSSVSSHNSTDRRWQI